MSEWIDVQKRTPEQDGRYAVIYRYKGKVHSKYFVADWLVVENQWMNVLDVTITHWMEFPPMPPIEEQDDE